MAKNNPKLFRYIISSQYFLYFGVMGIFLPYFNLYCYHLGFSGFQIGLLSAVRTVAMVLFSLFWGNLADRFHIRKPLYILFNIVSAGISIFYLYTVDFNIMLVITVFYGIFYSPIISFLETFTLDVLGSEKKSYGHIRVWGSISFIIIVLIFGKIIDLYSIKIILVFISAGSLLQAVISIKIPYVNIVAKKLSIKKKPKVFFTKRIVVFFVCAFLMLVSHGTYYGFFSIHLKNLGYGNTFIGIAWALAAISEITVMLKSDLIFKKYSMENVLVFSFMVASIRWFILFFARSPSAILISQVLHAVTYGTFHIASILYIDSLTPDRAKTFGQSVNNAVTYGLGLMVGFFLNGYLYEITGSFILFIISGSIAFAAGLLLWGFQIIDRRSIEKRRILV